MKNPEIPVGRLRPGNEVARVAPDFSVEWSKVISVDPLPRDGRTIGYRIHLDNGEDLVLSSRRRMEVKPETLVPSDGAGER